MAPTSAPPTASETERDEVSLDLPAPMSLLPLVLGILVTVVGVWVLAWLAWIP